MQSSPACTVDYIDHVGIAVHDLEQAMSFFHDTFGAPLAQAHELADQGVRACLIAIGQTRLELLQPLSTDSPVGKFLERRGEGLHHLALHVENVADSIEGLRGKGVQMIDLEPREGLSGIIAFLHPRSAHGILTELVQTAPQQALPEQNSPKG